MSGVFVAENEVTTWFDLYATATDPENLARIWVQLANAGNADELAELYQPDVRVLQLGPEAGAQLMCSTRKGEK